MSTSISFILPLYNGKKYIERAINSVLNQTVTPDELIIINDGSTDDSLEFVYKWFNPDKEAVPKFTNCEEPTLIASCKVTGCNVFLYTQTNQGVAAARNHGICLAKSEYLAFIDQDDYVELNFCKKFLSEVTDTTKPDMIIGGFKRRNEEGKKTRDMKPTNTRWSKYMFTYPWGRIIKKDFLLTNNIRFLKTGIGEDVYFDLVAYSYTDRIKMVRNSSYVWFDNSASVSNTQYTKINKLVDPIFTFDRILRDANKTDETTKLYMEYYFVKFTVWFLLVNARKSKISDLLGVRNNMFDWLFMRCPNYKKNPLLSLRKPSGEKLSTRFIVWTYVQLSHVNLDKLLLRIINIF